MANITQLLKDVLSIDEQSKLIDSAPTKLTNPYGSDQIGGLLEKLTGSEEGMGLANKALEKASTKNPVAREFIKQMVGGLGGGQLSPEGEGGGLEELLMGLLSELSPEDLPMILELLGGLGGGEAAPMEPAQPAGGFAEMLGGGGPPMPGGGPGMMGPGPEAMPMPQ